MFSQKRLVMHARGRETGGRVPSPRAEFEASGPESTAGTEAPKAQPRARSASPLVGPASLELKVGRLEASSGLPRELKCHEPPLPLSSTSSSTSAGEAHQRHSGAAEAKQVVDGQASRAAPSSSLVHYLRKVGPVRS